MDPSPGCRRAAAVVALLLLAAGAGAASPAAVTAFHGGVWQEAHATFYGDETGAETMQGACGYGNLFEQGYGLDTTALSVSLFDSGRSCGGCYELHCHGTRYCKPGGAAVTVTATNLCPANYSKPNENWCNPPLRHFDLSKPAFLRLVTDFHVGIIPVRFRRVPCARRGGVRFQMRGNSWWVAVLVFNVAGAGDVTAVEVRAGPWQWVQMRRNWGQVWEYGGSDARRLVGRGLSFRVTAGDGRSIVFYGVVPPTWVAGQSFEGKHQF